MSERSWYVYILRCSDQSLYTGIALDPVARVAMHNAGRGARYTRGRTPVELVYQECVAGRPAALRREAAIKRMAAAAKRKLVVSGAADTRTKNRICQE